MAVVTIFINYRTADEPTAAVLLKRELSEHLGAGNVFLAIGMIPAGDDFERELLRRVRDATVLLVVMGQRWLNAPGAGGGRAVDDDRDWVRREIAEALATGVRVIPVLIGSTPRLTDAPLPADIAQLTRCQFLRFRPDDYEADLATIIAAVSEAGGITPAQPTVTDGHPVIMTAHATDHGTIYQAGRDQVIDRFPRR